MGKVIDIYKLKRKGYKIKDTNKRDAIVCLSAMLVFAIIVIGIPLFIFLH